MASVGRITLIDLRSRGISGYGTSYVTRSSDSHISLPVSAILQSRRLEENYREGGECYR